MIKHAIQQLVENKNLTYETAENVMDEIMSGTASEVEISAFLTAMRMKGETIEEITACASGMRKHCTRLYHEKEVLEIVGTGGDCANTFNISTISSIVVSSAGIPVAKHGNRGVSSKCGAADVLEALGVNISIGPELNEKVLKEINMCFMFAQKYHSAMKFVAPVRKQLGIRTIFNILGPLVNPAGANYQLLGVYEEELVEPLAKVLCNLGIKRGMVVYGQDCLDEISLSAPTTCCEIKNKEVKSYTISPKDFGFDFCKKEELVGGNPQENAEIALGILHGELGPKREAVLLNAGAGIYIASEHITLKEAIQKATDLIDSGRALEQLNKFITATNFYK